MGGKLYVFTQMNDDLESKLPLVGDNKAGSCFKLCGSTLGLLPPPSRHMSIGAAA